METTTSKRSGVTGAASVLLLARSSVVLAVALVLPGCVTPRAVARTDVVSHFEGSADVTVRAVDGADADIAVVVGALPAARARLLAHRLLWRLPVTITIHGSVHGFIQATGQTVPTLRAWSTWREVHLLATDTWQRDDDDEVRRRITHELCHLGLWHRAGSVERARRLPRFVTEGVCSVVAEQGAQRLPADDVAAALDDGRAIDFVDDSVFSYAVAHHVIDGLQRCHGDDAVLRLIDDVLARDEGGQLALGAVLPVPPRELIGCSTSSRPGG